MPNQAGLSENRIPHSQRRNHHFLVRNIFLHTTFFDKVIAHNCWLFIIIYLAMTCLYNSD